MLCSTYHVPFVILVPGHILYLGSSVVNRIDTVLVFRDISIFRGANRHKISEPQTQNSEPR